jgi:hypothetical protein
MTVKLFYSRCKNCGRYSEQPRAVKGLIQTCLDCKISGTFLFESTTRSPRPKLQDIKSPALETSKILRKPKKGSIIEEAIEPVIDPAPVVSYDPVGGTLIDKLTEDEPTPDESMSF